MALKYFLTYGVILSPNLVGYIISAVEVELLKLLICYPFSLYMKLPKSTFLVLWSVNSYQY